MKYFVIINPTSGRGYAASAVPRIQQIFKEFKMDFRLEMTEYPWQAAEYSELAARQGYDVVVCAGGDGTVNEVINGLMFARAQGLQHTALGILSIGSGNDMAASLGLPFDLREAVQAIRDDNRRLIDIGSVRSSELPEGRFFGNCVGIGFDAAGTILSKKITYASGMIAYLIAAIQTIFTYYASAPTIRINMDGVVLTQKSLMVSIMNGRRIGGGFWTAPNSIMDDGFFDLCIARNVGRLRMFFLLPHFMNGTHASQPEIRMAQAKNVTVTAIQGNLPVQIDGEILCEEGHELEVEIYPKQLEVVGVL